MLVYGPLDPLAMVRHDQIVVGQPRWAAYDLEAFDFFFRILFRSFWGMFGWMGVVLDDGFYILYLVLTVLGVAGIVLGRWMAMGQLLRHKALLGWAALLVFGEVAYYNLTFIQPQGRYLFPALVPIGLFLSSGWWQLASGATRGPLARLLTAGVLAGTVAWSLGEAAGTISVASSALRTADSTVRAQHYWSDTALIAVAAAGAVIVLIAPRVARARLPVALALLLAVALGLLDLAAMVEFVVPGFPVR